MAISVSIFCRLMVKSIISIHVSLVFSLEERQNWSSETKATKPSFTVKPFLPIKNMGNLHDINNALQQNT